MWLYSILLTCSISLPLILSFDNKLQFYKKWKFIFPSILFVALFYIIGDIYLTSKGVWGFNSSYHLNLLIANLPIEEWLFFIIIPYACLFLHESLGLYFPGLKLNQVLSNTITVSLILMAVVIIFFYYHRSYTVYIFSLVIIALLLSILDKTNAIRRYFVSFILILIPFVIVNAILTGSFIHQEVVWYNNQENMGIRFLTIPIEDFGYAFSMILYNLLLIPRIENIIKKIKIR